MSSRQIKSLSEIKPLDLAKLSAGLKSDDDATSKAAGVKLARDAASFGISIKDYLRLAVGREANAEGMDGYERTLMELNLPLRNDFKNGVYLQAASDTFQTHPGTRALFPEVIDDVIRFATRQDQIEQVAPMLASSRTINGPELLSTVIDDDSAENDSFSVPELGRIPVRTIRTSESSVKIWKHGSAIRHSYEFARRASIELMIPHANRIARELERSKVRSATSILINGDGAYGAATSVNQSDFNGADYTGHTATNGKINWPHFLYWLVQRAEAGVPVDTVVMNWDAMFQWLMLFGAQTESSTDKAFGKTAAENLSAAGVNVSNSGQILNLFQRITPVLSSTVPAGKLIGITKGDTLEELREAGSDIQETERAILNQSVTMVRTENTGYKLVYGDTRQVFVFKEA